MALALYSETYWYPSGILAASIPATVFPRGSSIPAQLWQDAAGTIPLPNPLNTSLTGVLTFHANVGEYWVHIDEETFPINVGMSQEQADLSTGIASGGNLSPNALNPLAIDIAPFIGYISFVNQIGPQSPTIVKVDFPGATVQLDAAAQTRIVTWWLVDGFGNVFQQATIPTNEQFRSYIVLGVSLFNTGLTQVIDTQSLPVILSQQANQLNDLMVALGSFSTSGNLLTPNGVNLSFNKSAGTMFARSFNHYIGATLTNNPHTHSSPATTPSSFRRVLRGIISPTAPVVTTIDPANYDLNGVLTPVGGGGGSSTIQRIWLFAQDDANLRMLVQYGQTIYSSLTAARDAISAGTGFVPTQASATGALIGWIAVTRTATNLSDPTQAVFVNAGKFATP